MKRLLVFVVIVTSVMLATTFNKTTLSKLVATSTDIIQGEIVKVESVWRNADKNSIVTRVTVAIEEVVKGSLTSEVVITVRGGQIGDLSEIIHSTPKYEVGQKGVFMLIKHRGHYYVHSIAMGYYQIQSNTKDGQQYIVNPLIGNELVENDIAGLQSVNQDLDKKSEHQQAYFLQQFIQAIARVR
jgi:hypothetical protein